MSFASKPKDVTIILRQDGSTNSMQIDHDSASTQLVEKCLTFEADDKIMFEINMIEKKLSLWRNDKYIGVLYELDDETAAKEFTPKFYYWDNSDLDDGENTVKHFQYCVQYPELLNKDDKYGCYQKLLNICSQLSATKTYWDCMIKQQDDPQEDTIARSQVFDPAHMIKVLNEKCDTEDKMKHCDDVLKEISNNLKKVQKDIDDFTKAREMKNNDPDYHVDIDQVGDWIDSIEKGQFSKYSQTIKVGMQNYGLTAADIENFNSVSLKCLGMYDETARKEFVKHCQHFGSTFRKKKSSGGTNLYM